MTTTKENKMTDFNLTKIVETILDTSIGLIVGGVIGALVTLLTRVSKKEHTALVKRVDDHQAALASRLAEIEKGSKDVATEADLREIKAELKSDFQKALDVLNTNISAQMYALREDLRLSRKLQ